MDPALRTSSAHVLVTAEALADDRQLHLDPAIEHHLRKVLRLRDGEVVSATDGAGGWRVAVVVDGETWRLEPTGERHRESAPPTEVEIAAAMPKGDRLDWMVQKLAELGVDRLQLLHAERSVVRWKAAKIDAQRSRLQRIADEACRQSRRVWKMEVVAPVDASSVLGRMSVAEPGGRPLADGDHRVAVGPEGGWSTSELELAADRVGLTDTVLRTETAAVAVAALCVTKNR